MHFWYVMFTEQFKKNVQNGMFLLNVLSSAARALNKLLKLNPVIMSAHESSALEEVTLISQYRNETPVRSESSVKQRSVGSTEHLSEQDAPIHDLHQDACKVSGKRLL